MKLYTSPPTRVLALLLLFIIQLSCTKDTDLLSEQGFKDPDIAIAYYVKNDAFQILTNGTAEEEETIEVTVSEESGSISNDSYEINTNEGIELDVLANDVFENPETASIVLTSQPNNGTVEINADDTLKYTPSNFETTEDSFTYTVQFVNNDGSISTETAIVTVAINPPGQNYAPNQSGPLKAFPSAYGGGSNSKGGRGRALAIITTLNRNASLKYYPATSSTDEYYEGGLYAAMRNSDVGYIVFNVSGNIDLGSGGTAAQYTGFGMPGVNNKTIFGQSAPRGGITLTGGTFRLNGSSGDNKNLIIRYIRSRPIYNRNGALNTDDDAYTWAFLIMGGQNVVIDHCSASFAQDKAMGGFIRDPDHPMRNFTFSNNLVSDSHTGMYVEINPGRPGDPEDHVDLISWLNNVSISVNRTPNLAFNGRGEKINNIIHDTPNKQTTAYFDVQINEIGNYYSKSNSKNRIREQNEGTPVIFSSDNYFEGLLSGRSSENNNVLWTNSNGAPLNSSHFVNSPFGGFPNPINPRSPEDAFDRLVVDGDVGAYKYLDNKGVVQIYRDSFDSSQLNKVANNNAYTSKNPSNWVLPNIPKNTRPDSYDTDHDGMADDWERAMFGNLDQSYRDDHDGDGYENIEEYMNQVDY